MGAPGGLDLGLPEMAMGEGCRISYDQVAGWQAIRLENDQLRVTVLPNKGADICEFHCKPAGLNVLARTPWGLQPPDAPHRAGSGDTAFLWNYEGAWQELFPSLSGPCTYRGKTIPMHGEVALLPWTVADTHDAADEVSLRLSVRCQQTPFRLEREMRLRRGEAALYIEGAVTNESDTAADFNWGHHCVLGPPFLEAGCRLHTAARALLTAPEIFEDTARLAAGQRSAWPLAQLRQGGSVDLREVAGPEAHSHDDATLTDLTDGWAAVTNPRLNLTFSLHWDPAVFRVIGAWMPYGGADALPLSGMYGLGVEPWVSQHCLEQAVEHGEALQLAGGATLTTALRAETYAGEPAGG